MEKIQFPIYVTRSYLPKKEEFSSMLDSIWDSHWLTNNGNLHNTLEKRLSKYLDSNDLSLIVNGHLALETAITVLQLQGEIITTPFTFISTTNAIVRAGCTPVFCDIKESDLTIDEDKIEALITDKTTAIMPVHVYGHPCNVKKIEEIAKRHNLKIIYDAAHAFGVKVDGKSIATYGDISMFSFHATKLYNTIEGGALAYQNADYRKTISNVKNFGIVDEEHAEYVGGNAKMNEFQAAMGLVNLEHIDEIILEREQIAKRYRERLSKINGIKYFSVDDNENVRYNFAYFPIIVDEELFGISRDQLATKLKEYNVFSRKYFYPLTCDFACHSTLDQSNLEVAKKVSDQILTIPIYNGLTLEQVDYICDCIAEIQKLSGLK